MKLILNIFKITTFSILSVFLFSCSSEADLELQEKRKLKVEAQKKLEAEAKEIRAKAKARSEFVAATPRTRFQRARLLGVSHMKISALLAIAFGLVIAVFEAIRNWGDWQWWPWWVIDYIMAVLLITGGVLVLKKVRNSGKLLTGAWGLSFGVAYMSFWTHVENFNSPAHGNIEQSPVTFMIGFSLLVYVAGFALSLFDTDAAQDAAPVLKALSAQYAKLRDTHSIVFFS